MKSFLIKTFSIILLLGFSSSLFAGTRVEQVWTCTVNDGKTMKEVKALNNKWVAYVNKAVKGGDIQSYVATAIVGKTGHFIFVDSFPNMAAWAGKEDAMKAEAGQKLEAHFNELTNCSSSALYSVESS